MISLFIAVVNIVTPNAGNQSKRFYYMPTELPTHKKRVAMDRRSKVVNKHNKFRGNVWL
jgi:hypothetical protein